MTTYIAAGVDDTKSKQIAKQKSAAIAGFTRFVARARFVSPTDDLSILQSYLTTHTGLAALRRVRVLTEYESQVSNARRTLARYEASLQTVYELRQAEQLDTLAHAGLQTHTVILLTIAFIATSVIGWFAAPIIESVMLACQ